VNRRTSVYIIGGGPGDPGLLTVRGRECLERADVIVHDEQIPGAMLRHARPGAEIISVGSALPEATAHAAISYLLADKAREGLMVARLKSGDPFVFDRGGEEALYLHEQGVSFEIVPGVTAASAVPAYAGIPVTYPGGGDALTIIHGFDDGERPLPQVHWASLAKVEGTVVCYVDAHHLPRLVDTLLHHDWSPLAAAAVVYNGTTPDQDGADGTLGELADELRAHPRRGPAVLVIGRVVGFREHLRWFDNRPLFGRKVLVTRPRDQAAELCSQLSELGAMPVEAPLIRILPPVDDGPLREAVAGAGGFDWIVFTSVNAVDAFMRTLRTLGRDVRALAGAKLCAIGTTTAARIGTYGIAADLIPREFHGEGLVAALKAHSPLAGTSILLPHADIAREVVADQLQEAGAAVTEVVAYRTVVDESLRDAAGTDIYRMLLERRIDAVTFTSPSAVRAFATIFGEDQASDLLTHTVVASIGPATSQAVRRLGVTVAVEPTVHTAPALAEALAEHFAKGMAVA
jgi:uroporphyrinogen III methyltransferase/synthase